jgi:hypothetical protein
VLGNINSQYKRLIGETLYLIRNSLHLSQPLQYTKFQIYSPREEHG